MKKIMTAIAMFALCLATLSCEKEPERLINDLQGFWIYEEAFDPQGQKVNVTLGPGYEDIAPAWNFEGLMARQGGILNNEFTLLRIVSMATDNGALLTSNAQPRPDGKKEILTLQLENAKSRRLVQKTLLDDQLMITIYFKPAPGVQKK